MTWGQSFYQIMHLSILHLHLLLHYPDKCSHICGGTRVVFLWVIAVYVPICHCETCTLSAVFVRGTCRLRQNCCVLALKYSTPMRCVHGTFINVVTIARRIKYSNGLQFLDIVDLQPCDDPQSIFCISSHSRCLL